MLTVTTSPELAVPQSNQLKPFYEAFGLTSSNIDKGDKPAAYKCDIVYGSVNEFEGDVLRDEYLKKGIRQKRSFDIVIIDEADSMLVDGINNMTRLSSVMPGMNVLQPILIVIWIELNKLVKQKTSVASSNYSGEMESIRQMVEESINDDEGERTIINTIKEQIRLGQLLVPKHLNDFVMNHQLAAWVKNAFKAKYHLKLYREYVIEDNEIKIVDQHNSGIVFKDMRWSDGLHQFLQMKHDVPLTCEDLVTNYLANPTFFKRFSNIYGMTGTLGDAATKMFLAKHYKVDCVVVPPFKAKQHSVWPPVVRNTLNSWYQEIVRNCVWFLAKRRAVMIIADSILEAENIRSQFLNQISSSKILMYRTEKDSKITDAIIRPGEVIITTNICGRGVNIFLSDAVTAAGGLHICLTFLPENIRVEMQNIGRTSRAGHPGSSQIILYSHLNMEGIRAARQQNNEGTFQRLEGDMRRIEIKAKIFKEACELFDINDYSSTLANNCGLRRINTNGLNDDQFKDVLKEKFSLWLKLNEYKFENEPYELEKSFNTFRKGIIYELGRGCFQTGNMFFYILSGIRSIRESKYDRSVEQFSRAIEIDRQHCAFAYVGLAMARVSLQQNALEDLAYAESSILELIKQNDALWNLTGEEFPELKNKFNRKTKLLVATVESIRWAMNTINAMTNNKSICLAFKNWRDSTDSDNQKALFADAFELIMRGWMGPVKVVKIESNSFSSWFDFSKVNVDASEWHMCGV